MQWPTRSGHQRLRPRTGKAYFEQATNRSSRTVHSAKARTIELDATVRSEAIRHLANGKQTTQALINGIKVNAIQKVRVASRLAMETVERVKTEARQHIAEAKQDVPMFWEQVSLGVKHALRSATMKVDSIYEGVLERTRRDVVSARADADDSILMIGASATFQAKSAPLNDFALALVRADRALYIAKQQGRNRVVMANELINIEN